MAKKPIPFDFILDYLFPLPVSIKAMFGVTTLYLGNKILLAFGIKPTAVIAMGYGSQLRGGIMKV